MYAEIHHWESARTLHRQQRGFYTGKAEKVQALGLAHGALSFSWLALLKDIMQSTSCMQQKNTHYMKTLHLCRAQAAYSLNSHITTRFKHSRWMRCGGPGQDKSEGCTPCQSLGVEHGRDILHTEALQSQERGGHSMDWENFDQYSWMKVQFRIRHSDTRFDTRKTLFWEASGNGGRTLV